MTQIESITEPIESVIEEYIELFTHSIKSIDELLESLRERIDDTQLQSGVLNRLSKVELDSKTELVISIIRLVLINKWIEARGAFDSDEFTDNED